MSTAFNPFASQLSRVDAEKRASKGFSASLVHIGLPKTGTSFLRHWLWLNRGALREFGIETPGYEGASHRIAAEFLRGEKWSQRSDLTTIMRRPLADALGGIAAASPSLKSCILSSEYFYICDPIPVGDFLRAELGSTPTVAIVIRDQASFALSAYNQAVKRMGETRSRPSPSYNIHYDWKILLDRWAAAVGRENIRVLSYNLSAMRDSLLEDFLGLIGPEVAAGLRDRRFIESGKRNRSISADLLEFLRLGNERGVTDLADSVQALVARGHSGLHFGVSSDEIETWRATYQDSNDAVARDYFGLAGGDEIFPRSVLPLGVDLMGRLSEAEVNRIRDRLRDLGDPNQTTNTATTGGPHFGAAGGAVSAASCETKARPDTCEVEDLAPKVNPNPLFGLPMSCVIDAVALVANHLVVVGSIGGAEEVASLHIEGLASPLTLRVQGFTGFEIGGNQADSVSGEEIGFILAAGLDAATARSAAQLPLSLTIQSETSPLAHTEAVPASILDARFHTAAEPLTLLADAMRVDEPEFAQVLASIATGGYLSPHVIARVEDHVVAPSAGFAATGWAEDVSGNSIVFLVNDFRFALDPDQVFVRSDRVAAREIAAKGGRVDAPLHGFVIFDALEGDHHEVRLACLLRGSVRWSPSLLLSKRGTVSDVAGVLSSRVSGRDVMTRRAAAQAVQSLLQKFTPAGVGSQSTTYADASGTPELSIIIPFHGDDFYLLDHLDSQSRTDANVEWILVSDDPELHTKIAATCRARMRGLSKTTRVIEVEQNVGYARASNLGFREARADFVAFMHSDVYWRDFAPFAYGMELLRNDPSIGLVGFRLHYGDGTLQHAGMRLQVSPHLDGMIEAVHPGKGLPAPSYGSALTAREVAAVTGALIIVRRSDFRDGVFDEGFAGGGFEDADLSLRIRRGGKRIMLVECDGIFHFEGQSLHSNGYQQFMDYVNGARFTARWRQDLQNLA